MPLATLAAPETATGELMLLLASGLSMMILLPPGIGVAEVAVDPEDAAGEALAPEDAFADAEADAKADGLEVLSTKFVLLSPPQAASPLANMTPTPAISALFMVQSVGTAINLIPATSISVSERKFWLRGRCAAEVINSALETQNPPKSKALWRSSNRIRFRLR